MDVHGMSPLLAAVAEGQADAVKILLSSGASTESPVSPDGRPYVAWTEDRQIKAMLGDH